MKASRSLMATPKSADGVLATGLNLNGRLYYQPYLVLMAYLSQGSERNYFLTEMGSEDLRAANEKYSRYVDAFGERMVRSTLTYVRNAAKTKDGNVSQPKLVSSSFKPYHVFEWTLCHENSVGCLRAAIAFHERTESATEIYAAYRNFMAQYGESAVNPVFNRILRDCQEISVSRSG